jgi:hypothetical protein
MERFLFARVEAWVLCLFVLFGILALVGFGGVVLLNERGSSFAGPFGRAAHAVAELPLVLKELNKPDPRTYAYAKRFDAIPSGWSGGAGGPAKGLSGYVLLSRLDGDRQRQVVELVDLTDFRVRFSWLPDADRLLADFTTPLKGVDSENWTQTHFRTIHPFPNADGGLTIKDHYSPLIRIDACSQPVWMLSDNGYSHATEAAENGDLWVSAHLAPQPDSRWAATFMDDSLARVTADGKVTEMIVLSDLLIKRGSIPLLFPGSHYDDDPLHLNDIQPVLQDGPYWKKGDLFISLRGPSAIVLFRPSTKEIVWMKSGPWLKQHDVDILDDHRISVFSNNTRNYGAYPRVEQAAEVMIYDFATKEVSSPWHDVFLAHDIETTYEGLAEILPDGSLMVEETNSGRVLFLSKGGDVIAQYLNRATDGLVYRLGWSRYIEPTDGDALVDVLEKVTCND